jgi:4'-phosphopantetheinyl transferase
MQDTRHQPNSIAWACLKLDAGAGTTLDSTALLSAADSDRAARFRRAEDRARFIAGRGLLAALLRQTGGRARAPLALTLTEHGRPVLLEEPRLAFSISHAGDIVAVAVVRDALVGIDVEALDRRIDLAAVAARIFHPADLARYAALPEADQSHAFFRAWTGKEAVLKGRGVGLFGGLESIRAPLDDRASTLTDNGETWHLRPIALPEGYLGCLACSASDRELVQHQVPVDGLFEQTA